MMSHTYQTPEIVQRSAEEYFHLNKEAAAFDLLVEYMSEKKPRTWSPTMNKIMTTMIDLAIKFNKKAALREPFRNFRFTTQNSNISSFENSILYFISATEEDKKGLLARATNEILDMGDLDNEDPEELFLAALDSAPTEKSLIRNALRDLWETYKMALEIVSRNKKLEDLYGQIAKKVFEFCRVYKRRTEFRKICESLRTTLVKTMTMNADYNKISNTIDLMDPETNEKQILVRFELLEYAYQFELWQESFKILEDIHSIMMKSRGTIKPKILSDYFENLAKVFWKSELYLYHAMAYYTHYTLVRTRNKNIKDEDVAQKTCSLVLGVLCIPSIMKENLQSEDAKTKALDLLNSESTVPSKQDLITYIHKHNLLDICTEEVKKMFYLVQDSKNMVSLTRNSEPLLKKIKEKQQPFHKPLQGVIISKLMAVLSKVYTKLKIENLVRLLGSIGYSFCEKIIHTASSFGHIKVRIDHKGRLLTFEDDAEDAQSLSLKFANFSEDLKEVIYSIGNKKEKAKEVKIIERLRENARRSNDSARSALGQRQRLIDRLKRSVVDSRQTGERSVRIELSEEAKSQRDAREEEKIETKQTRVRKRLEGLHELNKDNLVKKLRKIKGFKVGSEKLEDLKEDEIAQISVKELEEAKEAWEIKEKEKEEAAVRNTFKRTDFWERAKREEYIHIIKSQWASAQIEKEEIMKIHKEKFDRSLEFKKKMCQAVEFREVHMKNIEKERKEVYEEELDEFNEKIIEDLKKKIFRMARESLEAEKEAQVAKVIGKDVKTISRGPIQDKEAVPTDMIAKGNKKGGKIVIIRRIEGNESQEAGKLGFFKAKNKDEEMKSPSRDTRPVTQTIQAPGQGTQESAMADDGWSNTLTVIKKEEPPKFTRGSVSESARSGPSKFIRGGGRSCITSGNTLSSGE